MKLSQIILSLTIAFSVFACQSESRISNDYLIGSWSVIEFSGAENVTITGEPVEMNIEEFPSLKFSEDKISVNDQEVGSYTFSKKDSKLTITIKEKPETMVLNIINKNEFETEDNMGLKLKYKRAEK